MVRRRSVSWAVAPLTVGLSAIALGGMLVQEYKSGVIWPEPQVIRPASAQSAPSDAIVLFDGTDLSQWAGGEEWIIQDGYAITSGDDIQTKRSFGDCQLHLEFACPAEVEGEGQGRGNSGVFLMGQYEVQILDSYQNKTYYDGQCGAVYKQQPPTVNACRKPGQWQTFDIIFTAPQFAPDGKLNSPAYITVLHNGVLIHNHLPLDGATSFVKPASYEKHAGKLPITIQYHRDQVRFRNIWIRENVHRLVGLKRRPSITTGQPAGQPTAAAEPSKKTETQAKTRTGEKPKAAKPDAGKKQDTTPSPGTTEKPATTEKAP